jgi:hypothetical protein
MPHWSGVVNLLVTLRFLEIWFRVSASIPVRRDETVTASKFANASEWALIASLYFFEAAVIIITASTSASHKVANRSA